MTKLEEVARALVADWNTQNGFDASWEDLSPEQVALAFGQARTALKALREPTEDMLKAVSSFEDIEHIDRDPIYYWERMIDKTLAEG